MYPKFNFLPDGAIRAWLALITTEIKLVSDHYPFGTIAKATFSKIATFQLHFEHNQSGTRGTPLQQPLEA